MLPWLFCSISSPVYCKEVAMVPEDSTVLQDWAGALERKELDRVLRCHWSQFVPIVFSRGHDADKEQRYASTFLFHPLEFFLCGGDPTSKYQQLKEMDTPSQICGHVFRTGEPTYSCRYDSSSEAGADAVSASLQIADWLVCLFLGCSTFQQQMARTKLLTQFDMLPLWDTQIEGTVS